MNRLKRIVAVTFVAVMLLITSVFATEKLWDCTIVPDFSEGIMKVTGKATPNETVTAMVLPGGKTPSDVWGLSEKTDTTSVGKTGNYTFDIDTKSANPDGVMFYVTQFKADSNGEFGFDIGISESGIYDVYFLSQHSGIKKYTNFGFVDSTDYQEVIEKLNENINNETAFVEMFEDDEFLEKLGVNKNIANPQQVARILFAQQSGEKLGYDFEKNKALYECCAGIVLINSQKADEALDYILYAVEDDKTAMEWYNKYITGDKEESGLIDKISSGIENVDELEREIKSALILFVVENPNGYKNIREIMIDFSEITGISKLTSDTGVYSDLAGVKFENIAELVKRYKELAGGGASGGSSGGGGGSSSGGGGGSSSGSKDGVDIEVYGNGQSTQIQPMNKKIFTDLDGVAWAEDAIVELATRGVIAGKGDNKFCPNDLITREEFTKLVVAAFASETNESEIMFKDVPSDRWSYSYIAKAKSARLINGYSETEFGATDLISRQDMAVIIYNAAVYKNVSLPSSDIALSFADDSIIAEYAKKSVYVLKAMGVINGVNDMEFAPLRNATRAEAAVIIYKLLQK